MSFALWCNEAQPSFLSQASHIKYNRDPFGGSVSWKFHKLRYYPWLHLAQIKSEQDEAMVNDGSLWNERGIWVKYHSQSPTSIVPALKYELLISLLTFSSGKVLLCRQTQIRFGVPCNVFAAKTTMSQQHFRWLWRNLCVRVCIYCVFRVILILNAWYWSSQMKRVDFLVPKQLRKSKIGLLEQIWAKNPYVTFFLGHPVCRTG